MRKNCAQLVHVLCRSYLQTEQLSRRMWTQAYLYPAKAQRTLRPIHTLNGALTPEVSGLVHTIHTPYKEQKKIKLNQLLMSTVENF